MFAVGKLICLECLSCFDMLDFVSVLSAHIGKVGRPDKGSIHWTGVTVGDSSIDAIKYRKIKYETGCRRILIRAEREAG